MKAKTLYEQLERDFIAPGLSDDWAPHMAGVADFLCDNFKKRSMGLVCDFTPKIDKVYTAVFPSKLVMEEVLDSGAENAMLFVHHPSIWDIRLAPETFQQMDRETLKRFRERNISIYNLHVPLDNYGEYSTSVTLAKALGIEPKKAFAPYFGGLAGVFGKTEFSAVKDLKIKFEEAVSHAVSLYNYGSNEIKGGIAAVAAGGGNSVETLKEVFKEGANVFITGIAVKNDYSKEAHESAKELGISIMGGTHYSTERFACFAMAGYFKKLGLPAEFIEDVPVMEDR
jgi:putative NIF3 family GTP cyclohydrolase 1 type 2